MNFFQVGTWMGDRVADEVDHPAPVHEEGQTESRRQQHEPREQGKPEKFPQHEAREDPALEGSDPAASITHLKGDAIGEDRFALTRQR